MRKYDLYKDTGIEWIGEIPEHWEVKKIKHRCYVKARVGWKGLKSDEFLSEGFAYLVTGSDFKNNVVNWKECYHIDEERYADDPYIQLQDKDLLITKDGTIGKLAIVKQLDKPGCLNSGIFVVRSTNEDFSTEFLFWVLKSKVFTQFNEYTSYGSTIQHLYQNVFVEFQFPFPNYSEQLDITFYLSKKTTEIDELIKDKQRLLKLYEEEKTSIINQAVTKGIVPNACMKNSGIDWIGEIPEHWHVTKLKYISKKIGDGIHTTPNYLPNTGFYFINGVNLKNGKITMTDKTLSVPIEDYEKYKIELSRGTILISLNGTIGKLAFYMDEQVILGKSAAYIELKEIYSNRFIYYLLQSNYINNYFEDSFSGTTIKNLSLHTLRNTPIPFMSLEEQELIINHIETELSKINIQISRTKKLVNLLIEYRTALISEVVTGKVKVQSKT